MANGMRIARGAYEQTYDDYARDRGSARFKEIAEARQHETAMAPGRERDRADVFESLLRAREDGWLAEFVFDNFVTLAHGMSDNQRVKTQAIANRASVFVKAREIEVGVLAALRRTCQICTEDADAQGGYAAVGSGFLVGPNLVLTNDHVFECAKIRTPNKPIWVRFDYFHGRDALERSDPLPCYDDCVVARSPPTGDATTAAELRNRLDYAILKVDGLPGHRRGWFDLAEAMELPPLGQALEIWQHPMCQPMLVADGRRDEPPDGFQAEPLSNDEAPPRIYTDASTLAGSSGGLVLDSASKSPVALHAEAERIEPVQLDRDGQPLVRNRSIPLSLIFADAEPKLMREIRTALPKIGWLPDQKRPILFREDLQLQIHEAKTGEIRIITVETELDESGAAFSRIGRTFTVEILDAFLDRAEHHIVNVSAALIEPDPFRTARRIVALVAPSMVSELPVPSGETTMDADATGPLVSKTIDALMRAGGGRKVWLVIDDLDSHPIGTQWGSSHFLIEFYRRAAQTPNLGLYIVLVGLTRPLAGLRELNTNSVIRTASTTVPMPPHEKLDAWIEAHLTRGRNWPPDIAPPLARMMEDLAREHPDSDADAGIEDLARIVERFAGPAFREGG